MTAAVAGHHINAVVYRHNNAAFPATGGVFTVRYQNTLEKRNASATNVATVFLGSAAGCCPGGDRSMRKFPPSFGIKSFI